ncbi:MAG: glycosyltransferase family 2 protein [Pelagibacteraceae bacterium]|nr:glycosyltransferase family 2 protein [Pelagibacteraceae bacterium]
MLVSIIIPYFKDPLNIKLSVNSVIKQTYKKWELIIVDDENSLSSKKILIKIKNIDKRIKVYFTKKNLGVSKARNLGLLKAKGVLISFLDSDDLWKSKKLEYQVNCFKKQDIDICFTSFYAVNKNFKIIYKVQTPKNLDYNSLIKSCPICLSSSMIKKTILLKNKFFNYKNKEDYDLWLRLSKKKYRFFSINYYLTVYRERKGSLSSYHLSKLFNAYSIFKKNVNNNPILIFFYISRLYINALLKKYI